MFDIVDTWSRGPYVDGWLVHSMTSSRMENDEHIGWLEDDGHAGSNEVDKHLGWKEALLAVG